MSHPAHISFARLEEIVGAPHVLTSPEDLALRRVDGFLPSAVIQPADAAQIAEVLRFAGAEKLAVIPSGGCTKLGIGSPPARYDIALDLSRMNRVLAYDPQDLTLGVESGMRIEQLLRVLAEQKQFLPLVVPYLERATIGGIVASNSSSPLRHAYGGVRDFCLGMEFVTGEGSQAKSGGRVVKNVTGYDLHKLLIGSLGTLGVITRVNFRTFPLLPAQRTFVAAFSAAEPAFQFCGAISRSPLTPQMVEIADPGAAEVIFSGGGPPQAEPRKWSVLVSAAGLPEVVDRYARELGHMAAAANADELEPLGDSEGPVVLARIREFPRLILEAVPSAAIFRIGVLPTAMPGLLGELSSVATRGGVDLISLTRASGIVYAALLPKEGEAATVPLLSKAVQEVFRVCGKSEINASAMLEWCPPEVKLAAGGVWGPPRPDFGLMKRVKDSFDPNGVLCPGRFAGGI
ncbi:MAG: FAD-binding oxidoreductase [Acidobacteriia bacterium]|nr:FAD-binding oxidoreductase [Terriglobia bacterium]